MRRTRTAPLLIGLLLVLAVGLAAALLWSGREGTASEDPGDLVRPEATTNVGPTAAGERAAPVLRIPEPEIDRADDLVDRATTVLWPVEVELELALAAYLPRDPDAPRVGSGAGARLQGRAGGARGGPVQVRVEFEAGPNAGRVLHSDAQGRFGAVDLYPGLNVVRIVADSGGTARRELRLRQGRESQLNLGFGRLSHVLAKVQDGKGEGIEGARVNFDGTVARSGPGGLVEFPAVTAGHVLVEVEARGYTAHKELVGVTSNSDIGLVNEPDSPLRGEPRLRFTLRETGALDVTVQPDLGSGPVQLFVLPASLPRRGGTASIASNAGFPWHTINPIETVVGVRTAIEGLPAEPLQVYAFRAGARAPVRSVSLQPGKRRELLVPLEVAPKVSGRVLAEGEPVAGARVSLEAPNRTRATLAYFNQTSPFLEAAVLPELPAAVQEWTTDANGRFSFTAWEDLASARYLEAVGPDGRTWAGRYVKRGEHAVDLELEPLETTRSTLEVIFPGRFQGLPVELVLDGRPTDPLALGVSEPLRLEGLREGTWRLRVTWHGEELHAGDVELGAGRTRVEVPLPSGAIQGQDEDTWWRAGKTYPFE